MAIELKLAFLQQKAQMFTIEDSDRFQEINQQLYEIFDLLVTRHGKLELEPKRKLDRIKRRKPREHLAFETHIFTENNLSLPIKIIKRLPPERYGFSTTNTINIDIGAQSAGKDMTLRVYEISNPEGIFMTYCLWHEKGKGYGLDIFPSDQQIQFITDISQKVLQTVEAAPR